MSFVLDPVTLTNLIFCIGIVIISCWWQNRSGSLTPLYIGLAFGLFAVSHTATLLGLQNQLQLFLIVDRITAYILVFVGLFFIAREVITRKGAEEDLRKNHEELNTAYEQLTFQEDRLIDSFEELQKSAKAATESRNFLENIINTLADPVFVKDHNYRWILLNDAFSHLMGEKREALLGKSDYDFFVKEEADVFRKQDTIVFESGLKNINKERLTDSSGRTHTIITSKTVYTDTEKNSFIVGVIKDITEKEIVETALRQSEELYRSLYHDNPSMFFTLDLEGRVISVNQFGADQLGYPVEELTGQSILRIISTDDQPVVIEQIKTCLSSPGKVLNSQMRKIKKDGTIIWVEESARIIRGNEGSFQVLLVCQDITERKQAENIS